jgi:hypothetical protein
MKRMTTTAYLVAGSLAAWMTAGTAWAQEGGSPPPSAQKGPSAQVSGLTTTTVTVEKVDPNKRELTIKAPDGKPVIVNVPKDVPGIENVRPGDKVDIAYYQSVALSLKKPGEGSVGTQTRTTEQPGGGPLPGGTVGKQITSTVKVTKVDLAKNQLTVESPSGETDTINVQDPQNQATLKKLRPGDDIQVTYTQAMAASMRKGSK